jgi:SOS regulatory protein LexA
MKKKRVVQYIGQKETVRSTKEHIEKLEAFHAKERRMPSYAEASKLFGFKSKDSAFKQIQKLIASGAIDRDRTGKLIPRRSGHTSEAVGIRLLGLVEAGFPTPAEETNLDHVTLDEWLISNKSATFMLKVKGDSMIDAGICAGDYAIVERTDKARTGQIVVAEVDGAWTMKYLRRDTRGYYLEPANKEFPVIRPKDALSINAVVKSIIRKYD